MTAILFGSIGTLADTSELQRESFNQAFREHGLAWVWSQDEYRELLTESGGAQRIAAYAAERGEEIDADAVHATKSERFRQKLREADLVARPGVVETVEAAGQQGVKVALVTTTSAANVDALTAALQPELDVAGFDLVLDVSDVPHAKPAPDVYRVALERLGEAAADVVAIEDNLGGAAAAAAAGITTIAFPGENNSEHEFDPAATRVDRLVPADLAPLAA